MFRFAVRFALASLVFAACSDSKKSTETKPETTKPIEKPEDVAAKPKLVLVVVLDQLPSSAFLRYAPHLPEGGVLREAMEQGVFHQRVRYNYAGTNTAPGHASIFTGEVPADHGVDSNDIYNYEAGARMRIINDGKHEMFGVPGKFASPARLLKPTVGDLLHEQSPDSKVISVSLKGRAAVVSGGQRPDFVTWYSPTSAGFTTSSYYAEALPEWMKKWNQANPMVERFAIWKAADPELYKKVNGLDDAPGEADWHGLGTTFPHDASKTQKASKIFLVTPQAVDYLLDMARALVSQYQLGRDANPDLLSVSISSTDYAGHTFGVDSWEYLDLLIKTDRALSTFVSELALTTDLAVVITSDHGGTSLAEITIAKGHTGGRLYADELTTTLEAKADKALGKGNWVRSYIQPYLYLHEDALKSPKLEELVTLISAHADSDPKVEAIFSAKAARGFRKDENWLKRDVGNNVAERTVALFVVPAKGHVASPKKGTLGTGHGTPWDSDREVPFLASGVGVEKTQSAEVQSQARVAPSIAALLGLEWPLSAEALPGVVTKAK